MPSWIQGFADGQPVTPLVEGVRGLLVGEIVGGDLLSVLLWSAAILGGSIGLSTVLFRRRTI